MDGLHRQGGARDVIELHGSLGRVSAAICLGCGERTPRHELDQRLRAANPAWDAQVRLVNPDGDAVLDGGAAAVPGRRLPALRGPAEA